MNTISIFSKPIAGLIVTLIVADGEIASPVVPHSLLLDMFIAYVTVKTCSP